MSVNGSLSGPGGATAPLSDRFQVGGCGDLGFKPTLSTKLTGKANRGGHPKLKAVVKVPKGNANIRRAVVTLPKSEILDQGHIGTSCTRVQFAAQTCPAASRYGFAMAKTPLLDKPLEGPVYLRASNHKLPDLVADLRGQIRIALDGKIESAKGALRTTFQAVPDAPVPPSSSTCRAARRAAAEHDQHLPRRPPHEGEVHRAERPQGHAEPEVEEHRVREGGPLKTTPSPVGWAPAHPTGIGIGSSTSVVR